MPRRLLQIVSSLNTGEATATMAMVSRWLVAQGVEVAVLGLCGGGDLVPSLEQAGVRVRWHEPPSRPFAQLAYRARQELQRFQPEIVHCWTEQANWIGRLAAISTGVPRVIASWRTLPRRPSRGSQAFEWAMAQRTEAYVVNSRTAQQFHRKHGLINDKLRLIPDGVEIRSAATDAHRIRIRELLGVPAQAKLVGAIGPLIPGRRLKDAIWSTDLLRVFYRDVFLVVVGDGPQRWRLERYARQVQDRRRALFLGDRTDWLDIVSGLDCVCQASERDSLPRAVLEAMAARVAVVATDIPAHRELIDPDQTGRLVPLGNRGAMARELHSALENRTLTERLTCAAQQSVQQRYSVHAMLEAYQRLYFAAAESTPRLASLSGGNSPSIP